METDKKYTCPRCHYMTDNKCHYIKHQRLKKPCLPLFSDLNATDIINALNVEKPFKCKQCDKSFSQIQGLSRHKRVHKLAEQVITEDEPDTNDEAKKNKVGMVYLVTSPLLNAVKAGYWTGRVIELYYRYRTVYGKKLDILLFDTSDCQLLEDQFKSKFQVYQISGEMFNLEMMEAYKSFLSENSQQQVQ